MSIKSEDTTTTTTSSDGSVDSSGTFKLEYDAVLRVRYTNEDEKEEEETVYAHRLVLSSFSPLFRQMISASSSSDEHLVSIDLDLTMLTNALPALKLIIEALYSGEIKMNSQVSQNEVLAVCRFCQISSLEPKIMAASRNFNINTIFNPTVFETPKPADFPVFTPTTDPIALQTYLSTMLQLWNNPLLMAICANNQFTVSSSSDESASRAQSEGSSPRANSVTTPPSTDLEKIVPNDDKEGWCRNKKYIEKVEGGFMCTVCRKIYGRYNSVSYHVTIYHRNPPIRCEENGCNFSTREARYIHFHKYYRHHIPLPENIDLGSRKCPFCRHVSKSPAMLEKHIARHESDNQQNSNGLKRANNRKKAAVLPDVVAPSIPSSSTPLLAAPIPSFSTPMKCTLCSFTTFATDVLFMHLATNHAQELAQVTAADQNVTQITDADSQPIVDLKPNVAHLPLKPLQLDTSI